MRDIKGLPLQELEKIIAGWGFPKFHAGQVFSWIYKRGAKDFQELSDLPAGLRERLKQNFCLSPLRLVERVKSSDGTEKFLFALSDANLIEAVAIPSGERVTGCLSTQAGCKFGCLFCASGSLGFKRNLSSAEIVEQALYLRNESGAGKLTHVVFMGTGEPLDNYENVLASIRVINSPQGLNIGARRITISTSGVIPGIRRLQDEGLQFELSVSLHAADDATRSRILPINKKYPLKELIGVCAEYIKKTNRQVTFEYILIKGLNSDLQSADKLGKLLKGLNCKVNLIAANPVPECRVRVEPPGKIEALMFKNYLERQSINATLRRPRGADIEAACGQLRLKYENK